MKIFIVSDLSTYAVAHSFIKEFRKEGNEVHTFDINKRNNQYSRFGNIGKKINLFWPVESWIRKGNRELAVKFKEVKPDCVLIFGNAQILYGTLAFLKSICDAKVILFWPDTLINLDSRICESFSLYDLVATYSKSSIDTFKALGCKSVLWLPFAGDIDYLGGMNKSIPFEYDISFVGGWRIEREKALKRVSEKFPNARICIKGPGWDRFCKDKRLLKYYLPKLVYAGEFGNFIKSSRINLNVIDDTNYPAANMRFFEIPAVGGLQLVSECPELEKIFIDKVHLLYFSDETEMLEKINWSFSNEELCDKIREESYKLIENEHNYNERVRFLIKSIINL